MTRSRIDEMICRQEGLTELTEDAIKLVQLKKLNELLCREHIRRGFYSHLPERLNCLDELSRLPFTTDEELAHNAPGLLLTSQSQVQRVLSDATSGTSGAAKRVFYTVGDCERTVGLFMAGLGELVFPGSVTMICMPFSGPYGLGELIAEAVRRLGARPLKLGTDRSYGELSAVIEKERPDSFVGMPVQLLSILRYCGRGSLRRALVSADACPESVMRCCENILGSRLFPHYGSREMALGGAVCCPAHEGMHLRENHVIAEIIDGNGRVLPKGEFGELVITTVGMDAMPLIRYRTGDYTRILPEPCPCLSPVIRLDTVSRLDSRMMLPDDELFSLPGLIDYSMNEAGDLFALTDGTVSKADIKALAAACSVTVKTARDSDKPLYPGKRRILPV